MSTRATLCVLLLALARCGSDDLPGSDAQGMSDARGPDAEPGSFLDGCGFPTGGVFADFCSFTWFCDGGSRLISCTTDQTNADVCQCLIDDIVVASFDAPASAPFCGAASSSDRADIASAGCGW